MKRIHLQIVEKPDPKTMTIFDPIPIPAMKGQGDIDYLCPGCDTVLLSKLVEGQVQDLVLKCPKCGTYGRISAANPMH